MIRILKLAEMTAPELAALKRRAELDIDRTLPIARTVIDKIRQEGDGAVVEYARQFDYAGATAIAVVMLIISFILLLTINALQAWTRRRQTAGKA